jgi:hypothetical protein
MIERVPKEFTKKLGPKQENIIQKAREEIEKNIELIATNRMNQKAGIDKSSIDHVAKTVLDWVEKTKDENLKWFYSKTDYIIGPHN